MNMSKNFRDKLSALLLTLTVVFGLVGSSHVVLCIDERGHAALELKSSACHDDGSGIKPNTCIDKPILTVYVRNVINRADNSSFEPMTDRLFGNADYMKQLSENRRTLFRVCPSPVKPVQQLLGSVVLLI